jgi:hypothetical protein
MLISIRVKRAVHSAGRQVALKGGLGRPLKIMIRCGLTRDGFHWPVLIFRKAKGLKALNQTTRICRNSIFNQYFKKQVIANYIVLNRFYKQAAEIGKPSRPKFEPGRSFPVIFRLMSERHYVYVDRIQYLNRLFSRHENKDQAQKNMMFFAGPKNIKNAVSDKRDIMVPETQLTVREVFQRKNRAGFVVAGIPESQSSFAGNEPSSAQRTAYISETPGSPKRFPAEDRIFRILAECSVEKKMRGTGQAGFPSRPSMLFVEGVDLRETGLSRIDRIFSNGVAVLAGNKAMAAPILPQAGRMQTVRHVSKEESQVFSRAVSDRSIGLSISQRSDIFRNALRSPDEAEPEFSRTGFGQGHGETHFPGKSGALEARAARTKFKEAEARAMKSALKRPEPDQAGPFLQTLEAGHSKSLFPEAQMGNGPLQISAKDLAEKADRKRDWPYQRQSSGPMDEKYALYGLWDHLLRKGMTGADIESSTLLVHAPQTAKRNSRFVSRLIAQSYRVLNRMEYGSFTQGPDARKQGIQKALMKMDSIAAVRDRTYVGPSGSGVEKRSLSGIFRDIRIIGEDKSNHTTPGFPDVVYQKKQSSMQASFPGLHKAGDPEAPRRMEHAPELVLKKEGLRSPQAPVSQEQKESAVATNAVHTIYEYDDKKHKTREINVIADRVYKILEKRISIEKDRRGLS